ncbi:hypothetical protein [Helicobacter suis]|uniref:hypothetical protein n=1 Tax=Helicobacter suis TaxID=104628 RepID=UPI00248FB055|nr:hypothetical protein [Helicobacter suis]
MSTTILKEEIVYPIGVYDLKLSYRKRRPVTAFESLILEVESEQLPYTLKELAEVVWILANTTPA